MKLTVKRKHLTEGDPVSPTGQPGKREQKKGKPTGTSGGSPTPLGHHVPMQPAEMHAQGQPHPDDPKIRKTGAARHPTENRANQKSPSGMERATGSGTDHLVTGFREHPQGMLVKQVRARIGAPASHHRMRAEGQKQHASGQPSHGKAGKPYADTGRHVHQPGHPEQAAQADVGGMPTPHSAMRGFGKTVQPHLGVYGTAKRFAKLRMTPKRDRGGAA